MTGRSLLLAALLDGSGGLAGFRTFGTVFGTALTALINAETVEGTTDDVVADTGQILYPAAADEDDGVLLEVMAFSADVGNDFEAVGEPDFGDLTKRRVRLFRGAGHHLKADPTALWAIGQCGRLGLFRLGTASFGDKLVNGGHGV